jgi:hypothetical protein
MAEIELSVLSRQCLNRHLPDLETVQAQIKAWQNDRSNRTARIDWQFTTIDARIKLKKLFLSNILQQST